MATAVVVARIEAVLDKATVPLTSELRTEIDELLDQRVMAAA